VFVCCLPGVGLVDMSQCCESQNQHAKSITEEDPLVPKTAAMCKEECAKENSIESKNGCVRLLSTYWALLLLFAFTTGFSFLTQLDVPFQWYKVARVWMSIWLAALAWLKLASLSKFADTFCLYHPVAMVWRDFGYLFPFIELTLAILFTVEKMCHWSITAVLAVVYLVDAAGVAWALSRGKSLCCGCMGAISLPLTWITVSEDIMMVAMCISMELTKPAQGSGSLVLV